MTSAEAPPAATALAEAVRAKLQLAPAPLKLADVPKGLTRPRKTKPAEFQEQVRHALEEDGRLGKVFCYPSGKNGEDRYWARDEKHLLREVAVELAASPADLNKLLKGVVKVVKSDPAFAEPILRELIGDDRLFEYPPTKKNGPALFGASPPPPPLPALEQAKHKKAVDSLVTACRKLMGVAGVGVEELLQALQLRMGEHHPHKPSSHPHAMPAAPAAVMTEPDPEPEAETRVEELILKAVANAPVVSLADLRREMPREFQGRAFDEAVLRLADDRQVVVSQDADPSRYSDAERADYVQDGGALFTTVSKWS
jgi:hypothetical protein